MSRRVVVLLEMAIKIGGDITKNLEMIQRHVTELQNLKKRENQIFSHILYNLHSICSLYRNSSNFIITIFFTDWK